MRPLSRLSDLAVLLLAISCVLTGAISANVDDASPVRATSLARTVTWVGETGVSDLMPAAMCARYRITCARNGKAYKFKALRDQSGTVHNVTLIDDRIIVGVRRQKQGELFFLTLDGHLTAIIHADMATGTMTDMAVDDTAHLQELVDEVAFWKENTPASW